MQRVGRVAIGDDRGVIACAGLLVDLDGTLVDHVGASTRAVVAWARRLPGWDGDADAAVRRWRELEAVHFTRFERGECSYVEQRRRRLRGFDETFAHLSDAEADALFAGYRVEYEAAWEAYPDALTFLRRALASGAAVGVLTNGDEFHQRLKLTRVGLDLPGLRLFASGGLGIAKPDPRAYRHACAGLGTPPPQTVMIGDDLTKDVLGAEAAGLLALHLVRDATGDLAGHESAGHNSDPSDPVCSRKAALLPEFREQGQLSGANVTGGARGTAAALVGSLDEAAELLFGG
ncbi:MAG: HAD family hydrolase [Propionicimonas sp.]|uniref:HAD family hydrolase n=1 Tax=Propionicimonas sp. TaxID=1955623 RepID=UPI003D0A26D6